MGKTQSGPIIRGVPLKCFQETIGSAESVNWIERAPSDVFQISFGPEIGFASINPSEGGG